MDDSGDRSAQTVLRLLSNARYASPSQGLEAPSRTG